MTFKLLFKNLARGPLTEAAPAAVPAILRRQQLRFTMQFFPHY